MNIIYMGTPDFAVPTLEKLIQSEHNVQVVVTQPDRARGRGKKVTYSPVKESALANNIEVLQPERVREKEVIERLKQFKPDMIIVVAFGQILPKEILELPKYGCINVHGSLLPKYRGAAPIQWALINGEDKTGVTTMYMDVGLDTGDMILKDEIDITEEDNAGTIHDKLSILGADLLMETIKLIQEGNAPREKQRDEQSTYAPPLKKQQGLINWSNSAEEICFLIQGLSPWPSAYTYLDGKILKIWQAKKCKVTPYSYGDSGEIIEILKDQGIVVQTGNGGILITEIQLQGRKRMSVSDFIRGYHIEKNSFLGIN